MPDLDRQLVDTIKGKFARKSAAQLQEIVRSKDPELWSAEAVAATQELLADRLAGRAQEPQVEEELPSRHYEPDEIGFLDGHLMGLLVRYLVNPKRVERPDLPVPFGPKMAWLAVDSTDTKAVATALGLREARAATWADGIEAAYRSSVFVTPPLADWTLAVGIPLFPPDRADAFVKPILERLSRQFGEAQYFCSHRDVELQIWARARKGQLIRGYGWLGQKGLSLWDEGVQTAEERDPEFGASQGPHPDEDRVMQLATVWSIDPTTLNEHFMEPVAGLLGSAPWSKR